MDEEHLKRICIIIGKLGIYCFFGIDILFWLLIKSKYFCVKYNHNDKIIYWIQDIIIKSIGPF